LHGAACAALALLLGACALSPGGAPEAPPAAVRAAAPAAPAASAAGRTPDSAATAWARIAPGLEYRRAQPWPGAELHLLRLDLQAPGLRLAVSAPAERGQTLDAMPGAAGALAWVNASFFDRQFDARGWTVSEGEVWPRPLAVAASPLLACTREQRCEIVFEPPAAPPAAWFNAVAGTPWLVREGRAREPADDQRCPGLCAREHPRTVVGLDAARRTLWIVVAEGRRPGVPGVVLAPLAQWLQAQGVFEAVNLDGGGSSALFVQGRSLAERPANESAQRAVANALRIVPRVAPDTAPAR
jgi:hypothetical protein